MDFSDLGEGAEPGHSPLPSLNFNFNLFREMLYNRISCYLNDDTSDFKKCKNNFRNHKQINKCTMKTRHFWNVKTTVRLKFRLKTAKSMRQSNNLA